MLQFKTNINCSGCVAKVTPLLNEAVGAGNWQVNTDQPEKLLTISVANVNPETVMTAVKKAGFQISYA